MYLWKGIITWLIIGALAGAMMGTVIKREKKGLVDHLTNMGLGLAGALLGGVLFAVIPIARPLAVVSISLEDVVAALVGSSLILLGAWIWRKQSAKKTGK